MFHASCRFTNYLISWANKRSSTLIDTFKIGSDVTWKPYETRRVKLQVMSRLCLLRLGRVIARHCLPQMKLRRAVYCSPTTGKTILLDYDKALLEHPESCMGWNLKFRIEIWKSWVKTCKSIRNHGLNHSFIKLENMTRAKKKFVQGTTFFFVICTCLTQQASPVK